ncbi:capsid size determination protein [Enterobacter hormaechei]|nr:capsid size determination protein [Enterobacter hormaechei]
MTDTTLPEYLKPAFNRLDKAKAVHTENARNLDEVTTVPSPAQRSKKQGWSRRTALILANGAVHFAPQVQC